MPDETTETTDTQSSEATTQTTEQQESAADESVLGAATSEGEGEGEAEGEANAETAGEGGDKTKESVIPEAYDLKLTVKDADGKDSEASLDPALVEAATPLLKEAGLSNEAANKLIPLVPKIQERLAQQQADAFAEARAQWVKDAQADPEIGGKNWKATTALAAKALDKFAGPVMSKDSDGNEVPNAFRQFLNDSGLGDHIEMIRAFSKIGAAMAEDTTLARSGDVKVTKSREETLYPDDVPKK